MKNLAKNPAEKYLRVMQYVRLRLDHIALLKKNGGGAFVTHETAAFYARKIVEGISFGCVAAVDYGGNDIPGAVKKTWNAEQILRRLKREHPDVFPNPVLHNVPNERQEGRATSHHFEIIEAARLSHGDLISMYSRLHLWAHELNPYADDHADLLLRQFQILWADVEKLERFLGLHMIRIAGVGFLCCLRDKRDDQTKVMPFERVTA